MTITNFSYSTYIFLTSFLHYIIIVPLVGIPFLVFIGYDHYKRIASFKAEADINIEANSHFRRILLNTEVLLPSYLQLLELILKISKNETLSQKDLDQISKLKTELDEHINKREIN